MSGPARRGARLLFSTLVCALAWAAMPSQAGTATAKVDLGDPRSRVEPRLGSPLRSWSPSHCPKHRIELRRKGSLWSKLVYGPDDRMHAVGIFRLALPARAGAREHRRVELRWPGLVPGSAARQAYPPADDWQPLIWSIGAKQWLWIEESISPSDLPDRARYLGGVVVNDASAFAGGTDFPHEVAQAITTYGVSDFTWAQGDLAQPLLAWRSRTPPNAYIETLAAKVDPGAGCGALTLAMPDYTDFVSMHR